MADTKYGDPMWQEQYERWTKMAPPIEFTPQEQAREQPSSGQSRQRASASA